MCHPARRKAGPRIAVLVEWLGDREARGASVWSYLVCLRPTASAARPVASSRAVEGSGMIAILSRREKIKRLTLERRKKENLRNAV